ncbi:potential E3 ubiquitin-protein ligase ariadne-1-like [Drosophila miranda]|uniref:potential E3 ubiquitin-protein ligase ariadne-1-like n=1 Tax=Drosophila miranda TaxID=7229 RepID=UPI0007E750F6|nr:potential E3 ubiquitin-protein ligase ariadne-1-like [Drosophila miranda]
MAEYKQKKMSLKPDEKCSICKLVKTDPVSAHCGHSFCWVCINEYLLATRSKHKRRCPVCAVDMEAHVAGYGEKLKTDDRVLRNYTMEDDINGDCFICVLPKKDPVDTLCGHSFCLECLKEYLFFNKHTKIRRCPKCHVSIESDFAIKK